MHLHYAGAMDGADDATERRQEAFTVTSRHLATRIAPIASSKPPDGQDGIDVLVVDDHDLMAELLVQALAGHDDIGTVTRAGDVCEAVAAVKEHRPDVVVMDFLLPSGTGIEAAAQITAEVSDTAVVMLSAVADDSTVARATSAGCAGFVHKGQPFWKVIRAVRAAARGERVPSAPDVGGGVAGRQSPSDLTEREREILTRLAGGSSIGEIAEDLVLSVHTVRNHVRNICRKLRCKTQLQAVLIAVREHLIRLDA